MEFIGQIKRRKIYYVQIRNNSEWKSKLPNNDWLAFTITNEEDIELIPPAVKTCLDRNVLYTCSAGDSAHFAELYFEDEICMRGVDYEIRTKKEYDYNLSPMTTAHTNFGEGFWFATTLASADTSEIDKVICLDFTEKQVKRHLTELIKKINSGWLPSDIEK